MALYKFNVVTINNVNMSLKWFKKTVLLIVNSGRNS